MPIPPETKSKIRWGFFFMFLVLSPLYFKAIGIFLTLLCFYLLTEILFCGAEGQEPAQKSRNYMAGRNYYKKKNKILLHFGNGSNKEPKEYSKLYLIPEVGEEVEETTSENIEKVNVKLKGSQNRESIEQNMKSSHNRRNSC